MHASSMRGHEGKRFTINLDEGTLAALHLLSKREHTPASIIVRRLIVRRLREEGLLSAQTHAENKQDA